MVNRRKAREKAFQLLFQNEMNEDTITEEKNVFSKQLVDGVITNKNNLDKLISNYLINWSIDRISIVDKTILRLAIYELLHVEDIPFAVTINEAIELAHSYGDDQSNKFINGILSNILEKEIKHNDR